jgi:heme exporter protein A
MLVVQNIDALRGSRRVLSNVSFSLKSGECLMLRGPNGSGKTTLLRTLAGLTPPSVGMINVNPEEVVYAAHLDAVKPQLTVAENIAFWHNIYRTPQNGTLERFDLKYLAQRDAATLSAGQKRRLGLSRLHASSCKIWLLDEPTTALDTNHVTQFAQILTEHCASGGIAVISTHLDLPFRNAQSLDITEFIPNAQSQSDPFLDGIF